MKAPSTQENYIFTLPPELINYIASFLSTWELLNFIKVCSSWNREVRLNYLDLKGIDIERNFHFISKQSDLTYLIANGTRIVYEKITILNELHPPLPLAANKKFQKKYSIVTGFKPSHFIDNVELYNCLPLFTNLIKLEMDDVTEKINHFLPLLPNLTYLSLYLKKETIHNEVSLLTGLTYLNFGSRQKVSSGALIPLTNLTQLRVWKNKKITNDEVSLLSNLRVLNLPKK